MKWSSWLIVGLIAPLSASAADPPRFVFHDGDRIVLIGDTLIERDQKYGYLETILTLRNPDKNLAFRNLGWSGDTVQGLARARFGPPAEGYQHLKDHVLALKPTVLIVGYGMTDSFDGEAGLPKFVTGLNALLDALAESKARVILLSPIAHADLGRPLPDPSAHNKDLERYTEAIGKVAAARGATFIDLFHKWESIADLGKLDQEIPESLWDNGIHLKEHGYWLFGVNLSEELLGPPTPWTAGFHHNGRLESATGTTVTVDPTKPAGVHFEALDNILPIPRKRLGSRLFSIKVVEPRMLIAEDLPKGGYKPTIDNKFVNVSWKADLSELETELDRSGQPYVESARLARGVELTSGPEFDQVEQLRKTINEKNLLYFHRWRPQNETYLFGFRKHEQGNNAREIPLFDPLVEAKEKEIATLRKPVKHAYDLMRVNEKDK